MPGECARRKAAMAAATVGLDPPFNSRANTPVTFATEKLIPLRLRSGGTPGAGLA